jgi:hypothetical protein
VNAQEEKLKARSSITRALIQKKALEQGAQRSDKVRHRVTIAMQTIEAEIAANNGIYPHNKGALSLAEVARRADVHSTTFFSPKQLDLGKEVKAWLEKLKAKETIGCGPVRKKLSSRVADWARLYGSLQQSHRDTELDLQQCQAELAIAGQEVARLHLENVRLLNLLNTAGSKNVSPIRPEKG